MRVVDETSVAAGTVLEAAKGLSARRVELWPDVHVEHLEIHAVGQTWADVTEGNPWPIGFVWERLRYDWSRTRRSEEHGHRLQHLFGQAAPGSCVRRRSARAPGSR